MSKQSRHGRSTGLDDLISGALQQAEAAVVVDQEDLARRREAFLGWMAERVDSTAESLGVEETEPVAPHGEPRRRTTTRTASPGAPSGVSAVERPMGEVVFLTVHEVAAIMRVSKMTVYRLVHSGHLDAIRVGRSFRVPAQAVREYLNECVGVSDS